MRSIVVTVGTRPEVIKMAPVYVALRESETIRPLLLSTGQHREMLDQALQAFDLKADVDLQLMQPGQSLPELTGRVINAVSKFLGEHRPQAILVQGDTTTVLAAALAAAFAKVPVGHVEAGLRTYDMNQPFPEEINRRLVSPLARWSFVPTKQSQQNLLNEHIDPNTIHVTGNSVIDALLWMRQKVAQKNEATSDIVNRLKIPSEFAETFFQNSVTGGGYRVSGAGSQESGAGHRGSEGGSRKPEAGNRLILVTGHRRESFGGGFESICQALLEIARQHPNVGILYPVHLNPNVREPVNRLLANNPQIALIEPVGYEDFIWLMNRCDFLLSDSGGVQEEAPSLGKPVLVMRTTTERPEGVEAGTCRLVGTEKTTIVREANVLLNDPDEYNRRAALKNPYGDGKTAMRIREILERDLR